MLVYIRKTYAKYGTKFRFFFFLIFFNEVKILFIYETWDYVLHAAYILCRFDGNSNSKCV